LAVVDFIDDDEVDWVALDERPDPLAGRLLERLVVED